jgi:uncharacterized repeat protein (TIGR01451 family)
MERLKSFVHRALKKVNKKTVLTTLAVAVVASTAVFTVQSVQAERPDCDSNAVMYCGAYDTGTLKNKYNASSSVRAMYAAAPFGISNSEFNSIVNNYKVGYVTRSNNVVVDGKVVATNAVTAGRSYIPGSLKISGAPGYYRSPSVSFKQNSLSAFVKFDANGRFEFAVIRACGNPVTAKPTKPTPKPNFTISKKVQVSGSNSQWSENVSVSPSQKVEYVVAVKNTGNVQLTGVKVRDTLPKGVSYVTNSSYMINSWDGRHGLPNGITTGGVGIGRIPAGGTVFVFFSATAPKTSDPIIKLCSEGKTKLRNIAYAKPIELGEKADDAYIETCEPIKPDFSIEKKVRVANTDNNFEKSVTAAPGTELEYVFAVKNTGNQDIANVLVKDALPEHVTFVPGSAKLTVSGGVENQPLPDSIVAGGYKIPGLKVGATAFVFLNANLPGTDNSVVKDCEEGKTKLINTAHADPVGPLGPKEDTADAYTCKEVKTPDFEIVKDVRKKGDSNWSQDVTVKYGDSVEYKITVKNTGETDLKNVLVKDARPTGVDYVDGTLKVNGQNSNEDLFGAGVTVPEIKIGQSAEVTFEAKVAEVSLEDCKDASFKNIASALPEGLQVKEDDAVVKANCEQQNPKVDIEKSVNKTVVDVNGKFIYTLGVTNTGDVILADVKVTDAAPEGIEFISANTPDGTSVSVDPSNFEAVIASLNVGQKVTFEIQSKVTKEMPGVIVNTACVDAPQVPGEPDNCDNAEIKTPKYECRSLVALSLGDLKYRFTTLINKTDPVELTSITYNYGDGSDAVTVNNQDPVEHQYAKTEAKTTYTATATVQFSVGGEVKESVCETEVTLTPDPDKVCPWNPNLPADSPDCVEPCEYDPNLPADHKDCVPPITPETPVTPQPPVTVVPSVGSSSALAGVLGSGTTAYLAYAWVESRRALKNIK